MAPIRDYWKHGISSTIFAAVLVLCWPALTATTPTDYHSRPVTPAWHSVAACSSQIFCDGPLLDAVQMSEVFSDSKTFVDMSLKSDPDVVLDAFDHMTEQCGGVDNLTKADLMEFVNIHFHKIAEKAEFEPWEPEDWIAKPSFVQKIKDDKLKTWALELHQRWWKLGRKINHEVGQHQKRHSLLYVPNPFIIPGGIFREFYYWDTYWVINGLLLSEMSITVKGMIENFVGMVKKYGFVPNGGRIYYTRRSQPPFLIPMVESYLKHTLDMEFVQRILPTLDKEFHFWEAYRTSDVMKDGRAYRLSHYNTEIGKPRPERHREDKEEAAKLPEDERAEFHSNIASGAETGWDFSTRWFSNPTDEEYLLTTIKAKEIFPVELNALLASNAKLLAHWYHVGGNSTRGSYFECLFQERQDAIQEVLWNEVEGVWQDYDRTTGSLRNHFYPTNFAPLFTDVYRTDVHLHNSVTEYKVLQYLKRQNVLWHPGGVPTTLERSGQQWDFPNAWPPLQHMLVESLDKIDIPEAKAMAKELAKTWIMSNYQAYQTTNKMFEKYNVDMAGVPGHGGEYPVQDGFGWSNGVAMQLMDKYPDLEIESDATEVVQVLVVVSQEEPEVVIAPDEQVVVVVQDLSEPDVHLPDGGMLSPVASSGGIG